ncbi:hypothetical protein IAT38_007228 [Cryptococcus sp. DSM 104549]
MDDPLLTPFLYARPDIEKFACRWEETPINLLARGIDPWPNGPPDYQPATSLALAVQAVKRNVRPKKRLVSPSGTKELSQKHGRLQSVKRMGINMRGMRVGHKRMARPRKRPRPTARPAREASPQYETGTLPSLGEPFTWKAPDPSSDKSKSNSRSAIAKKIKRAALKTFAGGGIIWWTLTLPPIPTTPPPTHSPLSLVVTLPPHPTHRLARKAFLMQTYLRRQIMYALAAVYAEASRPPLRGWPATDLYSGLEVGVETVLELVEEAVESEEFVSKRYTRWGEVVGGKGGEGRNLDHRWGLDEVMKEEAEKDVDEVVGKGRGWSGVLWEMSEGKLGGLKDAVVTSKGGGSGTPGKRDWRAGGALVGEELHLISEA